MWCLFLQNRKKKRTKKSLNGDGNNASTQNDASKSAPTGCCAVLNLLLAFHFIISFHVINLEPPSQKNEINHQDGKKCQEKNLLDLTNTNGKCTNVFAKTNAPLYQYDFIFVRCRAVDSCLILRLIQKRPNVLNTILESIKLFVLKWYFMT